MNITRSGRRTAAPAAAATIGEVQSANFAAAGTTIAAWPPFGGSESNTVLIGETLEILVIGSAAPVMQTTIALNRSGCFWKLARQEFVDVL